MMHDWIKSLSVLGLCLLSPMTFAHPHAWIDLRISPMLNDQGQITALREAWLFDPMYSAMILEEQRAAGPADEFDQRLNDFGQVMITHMTPNHYFNRLQGATSEPVQDFTLRKIRDRIELDFILPLSQPIDPKVGLSYRIYDPSYYIEMLHNEQQPTLFRNGCTLRIDKPNPDPDKIAEASALDRAAQAPPELGQFFAETGHIQCD